MITTAEDIRKLFDLDHASGTLSWRVAAGRVIAGSVAGWVNDQGYVCVQIKGKQYRAHRLIWAYQYGEWPEFEIDHINRDRSDNRLSNLRVVTSSENNRNMSLPVTNTSGHVGVYWVKSRETWNVKIQVNGKQLNLGYFRDKAKAIAARLAAEKDYGFHPTHGKST
jgi:hypothetical protein